MTTKTGTLGRPWLDLEPNRPPRVPDHYAYSTSPPPELSARCRWWLRQIERGWLPNRRISAEGYDSSAVWYGVWIWEYLNVLSPAITARWPDRLPRPV